MRTWEVEDNKAIPSDLVREQDFTMRIRRLHRLNVPQVVANVALNTIDAATGGRGSLEDAQRRLQDFAKTTRGDYVEMTNGDAFLLWPTANAPRTLPAALEKVAIPLNSGTEGRDGLVKLFQLPADYAALRERINHYIEKERTAAISGQTATPTRSLHSEAARGPLTAWSVSQIEKRLNEIDLQGYLRTQTIFERQRDGAWSGLAEEWYVGFDELRRAEFPHVELAASEHLFMALCHVLDRRLLADLAQNIETLTGRRIHINLSVASIMDPAFARFAHGVPRADRGAIGFELHCGDLLQDFALTLNATTLLHREGFKVAIDGITPDMLRYVNFGAFEVDYIKINVSQDHFAALDEPLTQRALRQIPPEKIIFFRCDNPSGLERGITDGVTKFQGWLIDARTRGD